jgi:ankyrin repeat protein
VKCLLTQEPELLHMEVEDQSRNTSMHLIVQSGNVALLKIVADFDPDFRVANALGDTPLHVAILNGDANMAKLLIKIGGEELTSIKNKAGQVPAQLAKDTRTKMELQEL